VQKSWLRILLVLVEDFTFRRTPGLSLTPCSRGVSDFELEWGWSLGIWLEVETWKEIKKYAW